MEGKTLLAPDAMGETTAGAILFSVCKRLVLNSAISLGRRRLCVGIILSTQLSKYLLSTEQAAQV